MKTNENLFSRLFFKQTKTLFLQRSKKLYSKFVFFFCKWTKSQFYKSIHPPTPFSWLLIVNKQKPVIMNCWTPNFTIFFFKLTKTRFHDFFVSKQKPDFRTFFSNEQKPGFRAFLANKQKADFTTFFANKWKPFFTTF